MTTKQQLDRIEHKVDGVADRTGAVEAVLIKHGIILDEHIKRTELLEEHIAPVQAALSEFKGVVRMIKVLAVMAGAAESVIAVLKYLNIKG